jgi:hypothetical protein
MSNVTDFLRGTGKDHKGRTLNDVWGFGDAEFDGCHDFIQWMFPLPKASKFFKGYDCPVMSLADMAEMCESNVIRDNLRKNTDKFLSFLGLNLTLGTYGDASVTIAENFPEQVKYWLKANDHNHLRINRMIQCLVLAGLEDTANAIFRCLVMLKCEFEDCITDTTMVYWRNALTGYSY